MLSCPCLTLSHLTSHRGTVPPTLGKCYIKAYTDPKSWGLLLIRVLVQAEVDWTQVEWALSIFPGMWTVLYLDKETSGSLSQLNHWCVPNPEATVTSSFPCLWVGRSQLSLTRKLVSEWLWSASLILLSGINGLKRACMFMTVAREQEHQWHCARHFKV